MITGHGDDAWNYATAIRADFSSNVRYGPLDPGLVRYLQEQVTAVTHYPEPAAQSLQHAAAEAYGVPGERVLATNGATEAIYLIAQAYRDLPVTIYVPAFAEYEDACRIQGMDIRFRNWAELKTGEMAAEGLVFLCNPNNPTGEVVPLGGFERYPRALFVVDESYIDFTRATGSLLGTGPSNVLVLRSLTKSCRIPGLRIGFVIGDGHVVGRLRAVKMPWSVNRLAIGAGLYIFRHPEDLEVPVEALLAQTAAWRDELRAATGWRIRETTTHYFLIDTPVPLKMRLLNDHGLLVRDASNFRGLGRNVLRVACQSPEHNQLLTEALRECAWTGS
jgi:threonine-phosphate decarboxylase